MGFRVQARELVGRVPVCRTSSTSTLGSPQTGRTRKKDPPRRRSRPGGDVLELSTRPGSNHGSSSPVVPKGPGRPCDPRRVTLLFRLSQGPSRSAERLSLTPPYSNLNSGVPLHTPPLLLLAQDSWMPHDTRNDYRREEQWGGGRGDGKEWISRVGEVNRLRVTRKFE